MSAWVPNFIEMLRGLKGRINPQVVIQSAKCGVKLGVYNICITKWAVVLSKGIRYISWFTIQQTTWAKKWSALTLCIGCRFWWHCFYWTVFMLPWFYSPFYIIQYHLWEKGSKEQTNQKKFVSVYVYWGMESSVIGHIVLQLAILV